ncbi:hypothetical protein PEC311524_24820 [Pectobacterium carotovorum subsp. carotovorum]|nr:hypothetical protein PEC311524_24820 [Pectobacterium carotovorum subsp. carotovorum]
MGLLVLAISPYAETANGMLRLQQVLQQLRQTV